MTRDEMIATLKEAGWPESMVDSIIMQKLFEIIKLVEAKEREACAQVAFSWNTAMTDLVAKEIRARGEA